MERRIREVRKPHTSHSTSTSSHSSFRESRRPRSKDFSSTSNPTINAGISNRSGSGNKADVGDDDNDERGIRSCENPAHHSSLVGTCPHMCPARERSQRERLQDLSVFERLNGDPRRTSPSLAVKKFCRTISTVHMQASDVRPLPVLQDTLYYLLKLLKSSGHPFEVVHDFVFDRTRSIRQDLSIQSIINDQAIRIYEVMVKFHIISKQKLLESSGNMNTDSLQYLNMEQLTKCLTSLYDLYAANRKSNFISEKEAEFRSFYVLLQLGFNSQSTGEPLSLWLSRLASPIIKSKEMSFARRMLRYFRVGNYRCFLSTVAAEASYLQYCLMGPFIYEIRVQAVSSVNYCGYKLDPYPLTKLSEVLMMKESDVVSLCNACGLEVSEDVAEKKLLPTKQKSFHQPKGGLQTYGFLGLVRLQREAEEDFEKLVE